MAIAGLWREGKNGGPPAFTMLTTEPSPDVELYHNRQVVVLNPEDWAHWIYFTKPQAELLRPLPQSSRSSHNVGAVLDNDRNEPALVEGFRAFSLRLQIAEQSGWIAPRQARIVWQ